MKRILLATAISLTLLSGAAMAMPGHGNGGHGHGNGNGNGNGGDRNDNRDDGGRNDNRDDGDRNDNRHAHDRFVDARGDDDHDGRRSYRHGHHWRTAHREHHDNGLHLGQHKFARGERLPDMYRQPRYYVQDYRAYHLAPPPSGYRWVRPDNGRYVLISTATGLISQLLGY